MPQSYQRAGAEGRSGSRMCGPPQAMAWSPGVQACHNHSMAVSPTVDRRRSANFEDNVNAYFDHAATFCKHASGLLEQIKVCNSVYAFAFPVRHGDGTIEVVHAWRAEH